MPVVAASSLSICGANAVESSDKMNLVNTGDLMVLTIPASQTMRSYKT